MLWLQKLGRKWGGVRERTCKSPTETPEVEGEPQRLASGWALASWRGFHSSLGALHSDTLTTSGITQGRIG